MLYSCTRQAASSQILYCPVCLITQNHWKLIICCGAAAAHTKMLIKNSTMSGAGLYGLSFVVFMQPVSVIIVSTLKGAALH